jgi:hypothetical protein
MMGGLPAYHPEWMIQFWFGTPGLRALNPHYTLFFLTIVMIGFLYFKKRKVVIEKPDEDEERFKHLLTKKKVIEKQMAELKQVHEQNKITDEQYQKKLTEFKKHLDQTSHELQQFTL